MTDPSGGKAAAAAVASATTGPKKAQASTEIVRLLKQTGDPSLKVVSVYDSSGPLARVVRDTPDGHRFLSPAMKLARLVIWLLGWLARAEDETPS